MKFKDNLRKIRTASNFSQEKLAGEMSVSRQTISKWDNGDSYPRTEHIFMLAKTLGCSFDELVDGTTEPKTKAKTKIPANYARPKKWRFLLVGLAMVFALIFGGGLLHLASTVDQPTNINKIIGYGISAEDGTFYIKCDIYDDAFPDHRCSAIIYFCEENGNYSCKYQILDDPEYRPSGEYHEVS